VNPNCTLSVWRFTEMGVALNHPLNRIFHDINHLFWGIPHLWKPNISIYHIYWVPFWGSPFVLPFWLPQLFGYAWRRGDPVLGGSAANLKPRVLDHDLGKTLRRWVEQIFRHFWMLWTVVTVIMIQKINDDSWWFLMIDDEFHDA